MLHAPHRLENESQTEYNARRRASAECVRVLTRGPTQEPAINKLDTSRFFLGQHTNERANDRRAVKVLIGARQYRKQRKALAKAARERQ